jgi:hypothetical protein
MTAEPGYDEVLLTAPDGACLCNSLACVRSGRAAEVIVTYGVLNDPGASPYSRGALWREQWGMSYPLCSACWEQSRQVAARYWPRLVVIDHTGAPAAPQTSGGRALRLPRPGPRRPTRRRGAPLAAGPSRLRREHRGWIVIARPGCCRPVMACTGRERTGT